jgi:hypothetical protein
VTSAAGLYPVMLRPELDKSSVKYENDLRIYLSPYLSIVMAIGKQGLKLYSAIPNF